MCSWFGFRSGLWRWQKYLSYSLVSEMFISLTSDIELLDIVKYSDKVLGYIYKTYKGFLGSDNIHWLVDYGTYEVYATHS